MRTKDLIRESATAIVEPTGITIGNNVFGNEKNSLMSKPLGLFG